MHRLPLTLALSSILFAASSQSAVFFSEYLEGASNDKALEIYNDNDTEADLSQFEIAIYFNGSTTARTHINLTGTLAPHQAFVVADDDASFAAQADQLTSASLFNGDDAIVLYQNDEVIDSIGQIGVDPGRQWGDNQLGTQNQDLRRIAAVTDTNPNDEFTPGEQWQSFSDDDFADLGSWQGNGSLPGDGDDNEPETPLVCNDPYTLIGAIQGPDEATPLQGQVVETEGVVTAVFPGQSGFYLQGDSDQDSATSDGIFVYMGNQALTMEPGDWLRLRGTADEYYENTQLDDISALLACGTATIPAPITLSLPVDSLATLEQYEGMLVHFNELTVNDVYDLARYGEVTLSHGRRYTPAQVVAPGPDATALANENTRNEIVLDDGSTSSIDDIVPYPYPQLTAENTLRVGDTVSDITGPLSYSYSQYHITPTTDVTFTPSNPRTDYPTLYSEGNVRIASFNVLNFFNGDGQGGGFPTSRGAETAAEFSRQEAKTVAALTALNADVIAIIEVENDGYDEDSAINELTQALSTASGIEWQFVNPGRDQLGTDQVTSGFLYRPDVVTPSGTAGILDSDSSPTDDDGVPLFDDTIARPSLAQAFTVNDGQGSFVAIVNHFRSKGGSCGEGDDDDSVGGAGACNLTRTRMAQALDQWAQQYASQPVLLMGDFNAYAQEDPIQTLTAAGYQRLPELLNKQDTYSYVYQGLSGELDHMLANATMQPYIVDMAEWHINADEPPALEYAFDNKSEAQRSRFYAADAYRASDHDPVIAELAIPAVRPDNLPPVAHFTGLRVGPLLTLVSTAYDPDGYIKHWQWQVNGKNYGKLPLLVVIKWGKADISLTVTDNKGEQATTQSHL